MIRGRTIFLQEKKIEDKFGRIEKDIPDLWDRLFKIYEHYKKRLEEDNPDLERCRKEVIEYIGTNKCICNISSRVKESDSLIVKIVNRIYANNRSAYAAISEDNYYKILTDLVAFRLIYKFPDEWSEVNRLLYDLFDRGEEMFVGDYCEDYSETQERPFLIEKPVIHYLPGEDLEIYRKAEREAGRDLFTYKPSADCYRGVHYLINYKGIYMEIQARLISDDLWSEIEHDTVYKLERTQKKDLLKGCASSLRGMLLACDFLSLYMREKAESNEKTDSQEDKLKAIQRLEECCRYVGEAQEQMGLLLKREKEELADETRSE